MSEDSDDTVSLSDTGSLYEDVKDLLSPGSEEFQAACLAFRSLGLDSELCWGFAKRKLRDRCDYSFASLQERLPDVLDGMPLVSVHRFFRKTERWVSAYAGVGDRCLTPAQMDFAVKRYTSHRCVPARFWDDWDSAIAGKKS